MINRIARVRKKTEPQDSQLRFFYTIYAFRPQQFLYFLPLPHGHGSLRPIFGEVRRTVTDSPVVCLCITPLAACLRALSPIDAPDAPKPDSASL